MKKRVLFFTGTFLYTLASFAQTTPSTQTDQDHVKSFFKTSLSYLSNAVYQGRKDSAVIAYIRPSISYVNKAGWNITGSVAYSPSAGQQDIELISFEADYDHKFSPSFSASGYAAAYFYNQFSSAVQAETNSSASIGLNYSPQDIFSLSADIGTTISKKPDLATSLLLARPFYFGTKGHDWGIVPGAAVIAGSQQYYSSYYTERKFNQTIRIHNGRRRGNTTTNTNATTTVSQTSARKFKILDYELSVPVTYDATKWGAFLTPIYAIPVHPLTYYEDGSTTPITETLSNSFYFTIGAYIKF